MDRWDDGDNCGYCVTGVRKDGSEEGGQPTSPQTEKDSRGTPPSYIFRNGLFRFFLFDPSITLPWGGSCNSFDEVSVPQTPSSSPSERIRKRRVYCIVAVICRRHVWLVFRICQRGVVSLMHKVNSLSLPPTICRAVMVDMGRSPFRIPHPPLPPPAQLSSVSQSLPFFCRAVSR